MRCATLAPITLVLVLVAPAFCQEVRRPPTETIRSDEKPAAGFVAPRGPGARLMDPVRIAGWPAGTKPITIGLEEVYGIALIRSRSPKPTSPADRLAVLGSKNWAAEIAKAGVSDFARFRAEYLAAREPDPAGKFLDPAPAYLDVLRRLQSAEVASRKLTGYEGLYDLYRQTAKSSSGIAPIHVEQFAGNVRAARAAMLDREREFRDSLDAFHVSLGLPPGTKLLPGPSLHDGFRRVFEELGEWRAKDDHDFQEIGAIVGRLPVPPDFVAGGISAREVAITNEGRLDDLLTAAARSVADDRAAMLVRSRVRRLVRAIQAYEEEKASLSLEIRLEADLLDQIIAPPAAGVDLTRQGDGLKSSQQLLAARGAVLSAQDRLVSAWTEVQTQRLAAYPSMGILPFDDWKSFLASFETIARNVPKK
ncbi:MAG: hypothetical protein JWN86_1958 [Planctomycetota bacterium]|nr:hypothetical protein [Planctomycetota bacterium]